MGRWAETLTSLSRQQPNYCTAPSERDLAICLSDAV